MDIVLYISSAIALLALAYFLLRAARSLNEVSIVMQHAEVALEDVRKNAEQMTHDVNEIRTHLVPVIDSVSVIAGRVSHMVEGLAPRVDRVYDTVDDALDIVEGVLVDVDRLKTEVVQTIESPLKLVRSTSTGVVSTLIKAFGVVKELVTEFKR